MKLLELLRQRRQGRPCAVLLDFDGTLTPIQADRNNVRLEAPWRDLLRRLLATPGLSVALVSGRSLKDLKERASMPGLHLVGNHGMAWSDPAWGPRPTLTQRWQRRMRAAQPALRGLQRAFPQLDWEDKGLDGCLHLRRLDPLQRSLLMLAVRRLARKAGLQLRPGIESVEIEPAGSWNKGHAVLRLQKHLVGQGLCFYAGDDNTDEWAFRALSGRRHCLSYKVGPGPTWAHLQGRRDQLWLLLHALRGRIGSLGGRHAH